jgi:hypothetical protein
MPNPALFAKVKVIFEDRIIVISASLGNLGFNIVPDFQFSGSNFYEIPSHIFLHAQRHSPHSIG